jgi:tight adherence protein C
VGSFDPLRVRREQRQLDALIEELPEVVDLLGVAIGAGLTINLAIRAVVDRVDGLVATELRAAVHDAERGLRLGEALERVGRLGEPTRPLAEALCASERYGVPIAAALDRVAEDARVIRRRRAEEAARRLPVALLFPLVCCVLPAFVLLTVVPLLAGSLASLQH